jgi:NAD(P)-dependent dehydrogenase (short-subunit alcohol dehydrogenase family)
MPTCLITGANRGIGLEFVKQYAADGWRLHATCRRPEDAAKLSEIEGDVQVHPLDVTDFARIEALARKLSGEPIDLLINNAGIYGPRVTPYDGIDYAAWAEVLRVNTMAPVKVSAVFADAVAKSELKRIVAISSQMGSIADNSSGGSYIYRSSKAGLNAAMKSLAHDLAGKKIAVAVLHPGWVRTDMGGSGATIDPFESVAGMRQVIDGLRPEASGSFFAYDGRELPW